MNTKLLQKILIAAAIVLIGCAAFGFALKRRFDAQQPVALDASYVATNLDRIGGGLLNVEYTFTNNGRSGVFITSLNLFAIKLAAPIEGGPNSSNPSVGADDEDAVYKQSKIEQCDLTEDDFYRLLRAKPGEEIWSSHLKGRVVGPKLPSGTEAIKQIALRPGGTKTVSYQYATDEFASSQTPGVTLCPIFLTQAAVQDPTPVMCPGWTIADSTVKSAPAGYSIIKWTAAARQLLPAGATSCPVADLGQDTSPAVMANPYPLQHWWSDAIEKKPGEHF